MKRGCVVLISLLCMSFILSSAMAEVSITDHKGAGSGIEPLATGSVQLTDVSGVEYFINTDITFTTSSSASGAASEASYTLAVAATTLAGGTTMSTLSDAFDGYGAIYINYGSGDVSYNKNGPANMECEGRQVVYNTQTIGPLSVYRKVFVPDNDEFIRWLDIVTNNGTITETVTVKTSNNLGSDSNTIIVTTSSGDAVATLEDTWVTTMQNYSGNTSSDPRIAHILRGEGALVGLASISFTNGDDNPTWSYTFDIEPGQTRIIMCFASCQPDKAAAAAKAAELVSLPTNSLQCMTEEEKSQVVNFVVIPPVVTPIPAVGHFGVIIMGFALGLSALWLMRRRHRA
jgi:hypothetical protein